MANSDNAFININGQKLRVLLNSWCSEHNTNIYDLSKTAGYSMSWLYDICRAGRIRKVGVEFLHKHCGIEFREYCTESNKERVPYVAGKKAGYKKTSEYVDIDGEKLKKLLMPYLAGKNTNIYDLSIKFGFSKRWLTEAIQNNRIRKVGVSLIEYETGIKLEDYKYVEPEPVKEEVKEEKDISKTDTEDQEVREYLDKFLSKLDRIADALEELNRSLK